MDKKAINLDNLDLTEEINEKEVEKMTRKSDMKTLVYMVIGGIAAAGLYEFAIKPLINKVRSGNSGSSS